MIERIYVALVVFFPLSEIILALVKRSRARAVQREDRGSLLLLWLSIILGLALANAVQWLPVGHLPWPRHLAGMLAISFLFAGLAIRWIAILTLGKLFTVDVAIQPQHAVVQSGLYRLVRHPSYTGLLIAFLGLGIFSADWLSICALLIPITLAVINRVIKEERALLTFLGPEYAAYCARTRRFIPKLL